MPPESLPPSAATEQWWAHTRSPECDVVGTTVDVEVLDGVSWRPSAWRIAAGCGSHGRVEPSRSVDKNVTVLDGSSRVYPFENRWVSTRDH